MFRPLEPINPLGEKCVHIVTSQMAKELFRLGMEFKQRALGVPLPKDPSEMEAYNHLRKHLGNLTETAMQLFWVEVEGEIGAKLKKDDLGLRVDWHIVIEHESNEETDSMAAMLRMLNGGTAVSFGEVLARRIQSERERLARNGGNGCEE